MVPIQHCALNSVQNFGSSKIVCNNSYNSEIKSAKITANIYIANTRQSLEIRWIGVLLMERFGDIFTVLVQIWKYHKKKCRRESHKDQIFKGYLEKMELVSVFVLNKSFYIVVMFTSFHYYSVRICSFLRKHEIY